MKRQSYMYTILAGAAVLLGSCTPEPYPVHFLTEADSAEAGMRFSIPYNGHYYNRMPVLTLKNFEKFSSFMDMKDGSYGVRLFTKPEFRMRLASIPMQNRGRRMLPIFNGLAFQPMLVDVVNDGQLVIWGGLNGWDLKKIGEKLKPVNPEIEKKRYLDENPRPIPKGGRDPRMLSRGARN